MKKILAIGNSFSNDATVYLHDLAQAYEYDSKIVNLYIGGCSLETHMENILKNRSDYLYELNGQNTGKKISIQEALDQDCWDMITVQQASHFSGLEETYHPYLEQLLSYVTRRCPSSQIYIHETWSYEMDSDHPGFKAYDCSQEKMYQMLRSAYIAVAGQYHLPLIPSGDVIQSLRSHSPFDYKNGGISLCRDGFHMNLCYGRYAVSATWYEKLFGGNILENSFLPDGISSNQDLQNIQLIKQVVHNICNSSKQGL